MDQKLIISDFYQNHLLGFYEFDGVVKRIVDLNTDSLVGNIYCGHVRDIVKNIQAAFVEFDGHKGFLPLKDAKSSLHQGDKVLVQVAFDAIKSKDYGLTEKINLSHELAVLTVGTPGISISRKIADDAKREEFKQLLMQYQNPEYGLIVRTKAADCPTEQLMGAVEDLIAQWKHIRRKFQFATSGMPLLVRNKCVSESREFLAKYEGEIVTDNRFVSELLNNQDISCRFYENHSVSLPNVYRLGKCLERALRRTVRLKSGAELVIDYTEALTVIDVNTAKAELHSNRQETFFQINLEAAYEIADQMELRNLSGIILVDFINLKSKQARGKLTETLRELLRYQSVPCEVCGFTKLGLMELSRKKKERPLYECLKQKEGETK